jgi:hypothetical protein
MRSTTFLAKRRLVKSDDRCERASYVPQNVR